MSIIPTSKNHLIICPHYLLITDISSLLSHLSVISVTIPYHFTDKSFPLTHISVIWSYYPVNITDTSQILIHISVIRGYYLVNITDTSQILIHISVIRDYYSFKTCHKPHLTLNFIRFFLSHYFCRYIARSRYGVICYVRKVLQQLEMQKN